MRKILQTDNNHGLQDFLVIGILLSFTVYLFLQ